MERRRVNITPDNETIMDGVERGTLHYTTLSFSNVISALACNVLRLLPYDVCCILIALYPHYTTVASLKLVSPCALTDGVTFFS